MFLKSDVNKEIKWTSNKMIYLKRYDEGQIQE